MVKVTKVAGGIVINPSGRILVTNRNNDSWSLPKGHLDEGEDELDAAAREIYEETGVKDLRLIKKLGGYKRHRIGKGGVGEDKSELKEIAMYLYKTKQTELSPVDETHPEARWVDVEKVEELLTHPKDIEFYLSKIIDVRAAADKIVE